jgi:hypothetical protein
MYIFSIFGGVLKNWRLKWIVPQYTKNTMDNQVARDILASVKEVIEKRGLDASLILEIASSFATKRGISKDTFTDILIELGVPCSGLCCVCSSPHVVDTFTTCSSCKKSLHSQCAIEGKCNKKCGCL